MRFVTALALFLSACSSCDLPPPRPGPPAPMPPPASCETACARRDFLAKNDPLGCKGTGQACRDACARYEDAGGALAWNVACMTDKDSCAEQDQCQAAP